MTKRTLLPIAALGIGGTLALVGPALPAAAVDSSSHVQTDVEILEGAGVLAKGAAVAVPVDVTCEAGLTGFLFVDVTQARGRFVANGGGSIQFECTGGTQRIEVLVTANNTAFKKGTAIANALLTTTCSTFPCEEDRDTEEITLSSL